MGEMYAALSALASRLNESRPARNLMEVFPRTIQFRLDEGDDFLLTIAEGRMTLSKGRSDKADLVVSGKSAEFAKVVQGKLDVTHPIARGHMTVEKGKVSEMTLLNRILWATERSKS